MDKESPEERLKKVEIKPVEKECLDRVFNYLSKPLYHLIRSYIAQSTHEDQKKNKITASDLIRSL
jgi:hypothetical protein